MDATSHMCIGDPIHMQTQTMGAFATFNSFQPTWEDLYCQSPWYLTYLQVKPISSTKDPQSYHEVFDKYIGGYKILAGTRQYFHLLSSL